MFDRLRAMRLRALTTLSLILVSSAAPALAVPENDLGSSQMSEIPHWPIYIAGVVAIAIGLVRAREHFRGGRSNPKVFPKLTLRRRLYAPYSGGNHAEIGFGKGDA